MSQAGPVMHHAHTLASIPAKAKMSVREDLHSILFLLCGGTIPKVGLDQAKTT